MQCQCTSCPYPCYTSTFKQIVRHPSFTDEKHQVTWVTSHDFSVNSLSLLSGQIMPWCDSFLQDLESSWGNRATSHSRVTPGNGKLLKPSSSPASLFIMLIMPLVTRGILLSIWSSLCCLEPWSSGSAKFWNISNRFPLTLCSNYSQLQHFEKK